MRRVRYALVSSLDGFIAGPNDEFDWILPDPEVDSAQDFSRYDTALIGRRTFDVMRAQGQPTFPGKKNYIFSRTLSRADIPEASILSSTPEQTVAELRNEPENGKDIWLFGGGDLFRTLLAARLVDDIELTIIPILLGSGIPLLPRRHRNTFPLQLTDHRIVPQRSGLTHLFRDPALGLLRNRDERHAPAPVESAKRISPPKRQTPQHVPAPTQHSELNSEALRRQMEQFFDATTDAMVFLDRDYRFTFLNRRANEIISFGRNLVGENLFEAFPGTVYENSPYVENYRRSMDEGLRGEFEAFYPEPLNQWLRVQSFPTDDGIVIFFRDFTEEKLTREAMDRKTAEAERQHAEIETIYRTAPIGLALFDLDGYHYLRLNDRQAAFFGLKPEQIVGRTLTEMAPIEGLKELFDQVANGDPVINYPLEGKLFNDPPDEHRYWTVTYFPVYGADGRIQAITAASLEITQQKKAELALIESEKLAVVGRLASSIAHEINNPLESVTNLLYLAEHSDAVDQSRHYIQTAEVELRRISAITSQTLRFHKQSSSPHEINLTELVGTVLSIYQGRIANADIQINRRSSAKKRIRCFEGEIRQVLANLISNALDAMPAGGTLFLRGREATNWCTGEKGVALTIADNGTGMAPETRARLFNPFFTTKGLTGTGLGLWVAKEIVDRHRGKLSVRSSRSPAHCGTVFTLFLPFDAVFR